MAQSELNKDVTKDSQLPDLEWGSELNRDEKWNRLRSNLNHSRALRQRPVFPDEEIPIKVGVSKREKKKSSVQFWIRFGLFVCAISTIVSGFYLYDQGSRVWDASRVAATALTRPSTVAPVEIPVVSSEIKVEKVVEKLIVRAGGHSAVPFHAGPGEEFPIVGHVRPGETLSVVDWKDQWFRVALKEKGKDGQKVAWIQNDWVEAQPVNTDAAAGVQLDTQ